MTSFLLTGTAENHSPECVIPDDVLIQLGPHDDEHLLLETCRGIKINTLRKSASSLSLPRRRTKTNLLASRKRVFIEKLTVSQTFKKLPTFYVSVSVVTV
jgi:hypothetical protein